MVACLHNTLVQYGTNVMEAISHYLIEFKAHFMGWNDEND